MTSSTTAAYEFKLALYQAISDLFGQQDDTQYVLVCLGAPANLEPDDLVAFGRSTSEQNVATLGNRSRDELLTQEVQISCFQAGGDEAERAAHDRAYYLLGLIETYCRKTDTTVGGTVMHCFLVGHESDGATPPEYLDRGRVIEITARFQAIARIT